MEFISSGNTTMLESLSGVKFLENDDLDLENGKLEKDRNKTVRSNKAVKIQNQALLSGLAYCLSSCSMVLQQTFMCDSINQLKSVSYLITSQVKLVKTNYPHTISIMKKFCACFTFASCIIPDESRLKQLEE
ncbi:hypothetical protein J1N35_037121 [Gossypium stocksii]|uniref:Uncharacterized protein n=1 Tax=Gossypium stocksii TaxID=47602 RepID=A0A9D3ZLH2_9ROSI|nr:hypothetical protein J1N35_037121 [Gossypium stocksii]